MFQLEAAEFEALRSQFATSNVGRGGRRYAPFVFTEHGAIMAAMVRSSPRAVEVSVYVVRAFVHLREAAVQHKDLAARFAELEERTERLEMSHDSFSQNTRAQLKQVIDTLKEMMKQPEPAKRPIGFVVPSDEAKRKSEADLA